MKFEEFDARMRVFETAQDLCVLPEIFMVVRLDGHGFTRLTKKVWALEAPFDERFKNVMLETTAHLFDAGFPVTYAYTQSDEISLLLRRDCASFGRKLRKLISIFAGEASARFSLSMGQIACFDARISQLPTTALVRDYFLWRQEDAHRNSLNAHCYWQLRKNGVSAPSAAKQLSGQSVSEKNEFLFQNGLNFNNLPAWQKRGVGLYWETYQKPAIDPRTGASLLASRKRLKHDTELPIGEPYGALIDSLANE